MKKPKLIIIRSASSLGGAEKYVLNLLAGLSFQFDCLLVSDLKKMLKEVEEKNLAKTIYLRWGREMWGKREKFLFLLFWPLNFLKFLILFLKERPQVVFCQSLNDKLIATLAAKILKARVFWIEHGPIFGYLTSFKPLIWFYKLNSAWVEKIIVVSRATLGNFKKADVKSEKLVLIYNGINLKEFKVSEKERLKIEKKFETKEYQAVGSVSRLVKNKGQSFLIKAAYNILRQNEKVKFIIVGEGPNGEILEKEIKNKRLSKNVILTGFRKDVPALLSIFDIFVHPSYAETEGLPYAILEAQAAGRPVIVTDVGGCRETLLDKETGFLIPPQDEKILRESIIKLLEDKNLRQKMAERAREFIEENFDLEKSIKKTADLFKNSPKA